MVTELPLHHRRAHDTPRPKLGQHHRRRIRRRQPQPTPQLPRRHLHPPRRHVRTRRQHEHSEPHRIPGAVQALFAQQRPHRRPQPPPRITTQRQRPTRPRHDHRTRRNRHQTPTPTRPRHHDSGLRRHGSHQTTRTGSTNPPATPRTRAPGDGHDQDEGTKTRAGANTQRAVTPCRRCPPRRCVTSMREKGPFTPESGVGLAPRCDTSQELSSAGCPNSSRGPAGTACPAATRRAAAFVKSVTLERVNRRTETAETGTQAWQSWPAAQQACKIGTSSRVHAHAGMTKPRKARAVWWRFGENRKIERSETGWHRVGRPLRRLWRLAGDTKDVRSGEWHHRIEHPGAARRPIQGRRPTEDYDIPAPSPETRASGCPENTNTPPKGRRLRMQTLTPRLGAVCKTRTPGTLKITRSPISTR
jgi:hypothetical protein